MECLNRLYVKKLCQLLFECFMGIDIMSGWETLPLPSIVKPNPVDEILIEVTVRNMS